MAPLNEDQLSQIRNERKDQIMRAALTVFAENGVKLTKVGMIAKEAGISHGLLYHYFHSKDEVLYQSLKWAMQGTDELFKEIQTLQLSPLGKIKHFTRIAIEEGNSDIFRVIQHITKSSYPIPAQIHELIESSGNSYFKELLPLFIEAQKQGEMIANDPQELLDLYLTVISGIIVEDLPWIQKDTEKKVDLILRMLTVR
ncbi:MAG: TetR/AcrR family transcriptional regulator [Bacillota bacterium]|uniref:TetR/AcrR family transcriptional regulator n=1 Tax=Virgibacillus salarius TaxID=447199 RepID=A0A941I8Y8_9BACI|nr:MULTISPECIES: TetR/AcrR family transcriptional regulator [Bacillaceae]NAZ07693.1 TetR family transcriptional regulator [Agaribacter marinus]MBR7794973.1 TetR/AcrR family transcriptional regulator [Virgibacillus salarius]MCC2252538.1 TetR/AcrR family transcriptional regulator [Virgibacillus sp. AGTR]MDY7046091.1 TetR/AcrR family transcriptional regulator [Virgibacillus sp. M23]QRZ18744.1 TetR/AcrR family transcriptional regulator [Virgibacillus sp. AGTR]